MVSLIFIGRSLERGAETPKRRARRAKFLSITYNITSKRRKIKKQRRVLREKSAKTRVAVRLKRFCRKTELVRSFAAPTAPVAKKKKKRQTRLKTRLTTRRDRKDEESWKNFKNAPCVVANLGYNRSRELGLTRTSFRVGF